MSTGKKVFIGLLAIVIFGGGVWWLSKSPTEQNKDYTQFAQCLAEKKLTMYGADWCPHCQTEKKLFGDSFKYVPYVECPNNTKLCLDKGIQGYPTWIDSNGKKYEGEQGLNKLAEISNCKLP